MESLSKKNTKVLLLVAHPDDEAIFCGGTMLMYGDCQWTVISMTDDGRPEAFKNAIENFKKLGVNIVDYKTLGQKNVPIQAKLSDLEGEEKLWESILKQENLSADLVITHNEMGEYGHAAHKLLSVVADSVFRNVWKFVYPEVRQTYEKIKIEHKLDDQILKIKKDIFNKNYPTEQYIWKDLAQVMNYEFESGAEIFTGGGRLEQSKPKILVILPDRFVKSTGGIGANSAPVFEKLSSEYDFYVAGHSLAGTEAPSFLKAYKEVAAPFTEVRSGALNTMIAQAPYLAAAIRFPKPDLVYAFDWSIYLAARETAKHFGVPLVARMSMSPILLAEQGYTFGLNLSNPLEKALHNSFCEMEIRGLKNADRIVQVSHAYTKMYEHVAPTFGAKLAW